jgi:predicted aconitase with swiveling domain
VIVEIVCHKVSCGYASGEALATGEPISFLGNVDPQTGIVIDPGHELCGRCIAGKVLIFPGGKGSTVGSYVIYQLKKRGVAPAAMINVRSEPIVAVGAIICGIPLVDRVPEEILRIKEGSLVTVDADNEIVRLPGLSGITLDRL